MMQRDEYRGANFNDGDQIDLQLANRDLRSFEEVKEVREFDALTKEMYRLTRDILIEKDSPEQPIPIRIPQDSKELVETMSKGMVHMREFKKMSSLTGGINSNISWLHAPNTHHEERSAV